MTAEDLIRILQRYPNQAEVFVSLGANDPEMRSLGGVREGQLLEKVSRIQNKSSMGIYFPQSHLEPTSAVILLA